MRAISIHQPWATMIIRGYKTIETRKHDRFKSLVGQTIAIHAAKRYDIDALKIVWWETLGLRGDLTYCAQIAAKVGGAIIGTAKVIDARWLTVNDFESALCSCSGLYGLMLSDLVEFQTPIPYKGQQGIFSIPEKMLNESIIIK